MSRIGKKPIPIPSGVEVTVNGNEFSAKGPRGKLSRTLPYDMKIELNEGIINVSRPTDSKPHRSMHGLTRTLVANMIHGVNEGFIKKLEIVGVGYRAQKSGDNLTLQVGHSHPVEIAAPEGISFSMEGNNRITVAGIDKELVGQIAAEIRSVRAPDHYKGKGIRYEGERVRLKAGKAGKLGKK